MTPVKESIGVFPLSFQYAVLKVQKNRERMIFRSLSSHNLYVDYPLTHGFKVMQTGHRAPGHRLTETIHIEEHIHHLCADLPF